MPAIIGMAWALLPNITIAASRPSGSKPSWASRTNAPNSERRSALTSAGVFWIAVRATRLNFSTRDVRRERGFEFRLHCREVLADHRDGVGDVSSVDCGCHVQVSSFTVILRYARGP
jgi:hypothetical protein